MRIQLRYLALFLGLFSAIIRETAAQENGRAATIKNLVFEGGGIRGIAYTGALTELNNRHILDSIERVAGTSAGAIAATLYALGYNPEEISRLISELKVKSFADGKWIFIGGTRRLIKNFGWYRGEKFNKWIGQLIKKKTGKENISFDELHKLREKNNTFKDLYLTGTNLSQQRVTIFSHETYPAMEVRTAVRISMSIPFYFQAIVIDQKGKIITNRKEYCNGNVMIDGGLIANFPIHVFDYKKYLSSGGDSTIINNQQTLGLRLDKEIQISHDRQALGLAPVEIVKFKNYVEAFYNIVIENLNRQNLTEADWKRTISINTAGIGPKIQSMSDEEKNRLIESGKRGVIEYFENKSK
jgi:NTE family protein